MLGIGKSTSEKPQKSSRIRTAAGALALTASLAGVGIGAKQMAELPKDTQPRVEVSLVPAVSAVQNPESEPAATDITTADRGAEASAAKASGSYRQLEDGTVEQLPQDPTLSVPTDGLEEAMIPPILIVADQAPAEVGQAAVQEAGQPQKVLKG